MNEDSTSRADIACSMLCTNSHRDPLSPRADAVTASRFTTNGPVEGTSNWAGSPPLCAPASRKAKSAFAASGAGTARAETTPLLANERRNSTISLEQAAHLTAFRDRGIGAFVIGTTGG